MNDFIKTSNSRLSNKVNNLKKTCVYGYKKLKKKTKNKTIKYLQKYLDISIHKI
jgi:hypothetical protein